MHQEHISIKEAPNKDEPYLAWPEFTLRHPDSEVDHQLGLMRLSVSGRLSPSVVLRTVAWRTMGPTGAGA